jgi:predicted DNA-binding antitoxin AbrB/MazE fold protein
MTRRIKARFSQGVFEPLEPTETDFVKDGEEVTLTIETSAPGSSDDWLRETAGGWQNLIDAAALKAAIDHDRRLVTRRPVRM